MRQGRVGSAVSREGCAVGWPADQLANRPSGTPCRTVQLVGFLPSSDGQQTAALPQTHRIRILRPSLGTPSRLVQGASLSESITPRADHSSSCFLIASPAVAAGLSSRNCRKCIADKAKSPLLA